MLNKNEWLEIMLPRLEAYSQDKSPGICPPEKMFHGSPYAGTKNFDVERGQGFGVWFQNSLEHAAWFAVERCRYLDEAKPSVYEASLAFKKLAVFPSEISLYNVHIPIPNDPVQEVSPIRPDGFSEIASIFRTKGYDGIFLEDRDTFSALQPEVITIKAEYPALPIFNKTKLPEIQRQWGSSYQSGYSFLKKLSM